MLSLTPAPRAALLARDRARSDDLEADDGPDPVPPPAEPPIHPFTGKFADAEHTVAYPEERGSPWSRDSCLRGDQKAAGSFCGCWTLGNAKHTIVGVVHVG